MFKDSRVISAFFQQRLDAGYIFEKWNRHHGFVWLQSWKLSSAIKTLLLLAYTTQDVKHIELLTKHKFRPEQKMQLLVCKTQILCCQHNPRKRVNKLGLLDSLNILRTCTFDAVPNNHWWLNVEKSPVNFFRVQNTPRIMYIYYNLELWPFTDTYASFH